MVVGCIVIEPVMIEKEWKVDQQMKQIDMLSQVDGLPSTGTLKLTHS